MSAMLWQQFEQVCSVRNETAAVLHGHLRTSFSDLLAMAKAQAATLPAVKAGDRVLLSGENSAEVLATVAAVWQRGAIPVPLHVDAPPAHLEHAMSVTRPSASFADPEAPLANLVSCRPLMAASGTPPAAQFQDPAGRSNYGSIVFTSGSSGLPKGVAQSAETLLGGAKRVSDLLGYKANDRILCPIPFAFDYGWGQALSLLLQGQPLVLPQPGNTFGLCEALEAHKPTVFAAVPAVLAELTSGLAPIADTPRAPIRLITNTGSRIAPAVLSRVRELFPDADLALNYGLTETYRSACLPVHEASSHPTSVGYALSGARLDVLRGDGSIATPNEEGEIVHSGAGTFLGYWGDPERTADVLRPHPVTGEPAVYTGDLGRKDIDGRLYIHGRRDRQLKSMGVRVAPDEVEGLLMDSGLLQTAAISSLPHDMIGDMIVACVVARDRSKSEKEITKALRIHARKFMSTHMQPRKYLVLCALPETRSAKTDYHTLDEIIRASA